MCSSPPVVKACPERSRMDQAHVFERGIERPNGGAVGVGRRGQAVLGIVGIEGHTVEAYPEPIQLRSG